MNVTPLDVWTARLSGMRLGLRRDRPTGVGFSWDCPSWTVQVCRDRSGGIPGSATAVVVQNVGVGSRVQLRCPGTPELLIL
jgi:hypothetical protein